MCTCALKSRFTLYVRCERFVPEFTLRATNSAGSPSIVLLDKWLPNVMDPHKRACKHANKKAALGPEHGNGSRVTKRFLVSTKLTPRSRCWEIDVGCGIKKRRWERRVPRRVTVTLERGKKFALVLILKPSVLSFVTFKWALSRSASHRSHCNKRGSGVKLT